MSELHVVFGGGALGVAVAKQALARGHRVRVVSRSGKATVPAGAEVGRADVADAAAATEAARGASAVYFCAAPPYTAGRSTTQRCSAGWWRPRRGPERGW